MAKKDEIKDTCADCGVELSDLKWPAVDSSGKVQCAKCSGMGYRCPACGAEMALPIVPRKCPACRCSVALEKL